MTDKEAELKQQESNEEIDPNVNIEPEASSSKIDQVDPVDEASLELTARLQDGNNFDFRLARDYNLEVITNAVSTNWTLWDEATRMRISGLLINAYKYDIPKGLAVPALRVGVASKILEVDPTNALRILVSVAIHLAKGAKPLKPGELSPQLCKVIPTHFLTGEVPRYELLFIRSRTEETRVFVQHLVAVVAGQQSYDLKDPAITSKQHQLFKSFLNHDIFPQLDQLSFGMIIGAVKSWPMSMLPDLIEFCGLYSAKYPDMQNPFETVVAPVASMESRERLPSDAPANKPAERNLLEPSEVITVIRDCFDKLGSDLAKKDSEIETLRKRIMQSNSDRHQLDEGKENKRKAIEELREKIGDLRDEISALNATVRCKDEAIATIQKDNARLDHEVKSREAKIAEITDKHEQDINQLVQRIDSVSDHKVSELKRSIEIDLRPVFDELSHLPNDESCLFHMDILESISRKLRQKGIEIRGGQK